MTVELLTVDEVAKITGLSAYTIRAAVRDCDLPASKLRGRIRIRPDDLAGWVDANRVTPAGVTERGLRAVPAPPRSQPPTGGYRQAAKQRKDAA